ncbi:hypothetical protein BDF19DRAFT_453059 [Syncephalis fuscata]|nr:hypothetical protein BDF19DRAFT_453059 [Syncephalis fuscata]
MSIRADSTFEPREEDDGFFAPQAKVHYYYRDSCCALTDKELIIYSYFAPGISKTLALSDIESAYTDRELDLPWFSRKFNGLSSDGSTWWALDWHRSLPFIKEARDCVLVTVKNDWLRKGFSVEDSKRFMVLLRDAIKQVRKNTTMERHNTGQSI